MQEENQAPFVDEPLPFGAPKQQALLGHILINPRFFDQVKDKIKANWFVDPYCATIYKMLLDESTAGKRKLSPDELKGCQTLLNADIKERARIQSAIDMAIAESGRFGLDLMTPELTDWLRARIFIEQVYKARDLFNSSRNAQDIPSSRVRRDESYRILHEMSRTIENTTFDDEGAIGFKDIPKDLEVYQTEYKNALTFGSTVFDKLLLPEADGRGSLLLGDMTVLLGPQNSGKTSCMLTTVCANVRVGKNTLLIAHEGRPNDLKLKLLQCFLGMTKRELFYNANNPAMKTNWDQVSDYLDQHLVYHPMIKAGLTIEEVSVVIKREMDRFAASHKGAKIDLVVDDYLARLYTLQNGRGQLQKRERDQAVYEYGTSLAGELDIHLLTAIQVNRTGNDINRGIKKNVESRLLVPEDVSESYGTIMVAANVISLNRSPLAQMRNRVTFLIAKSRTSEVHIAVACGSKYGTCLTHDNELGATWYTGLDPMEERIDELMKIYRNMEIPNQLVLNPPEP